MGIPLQETATHERSDFPGLSSTEAASLRAQVGPNAVVEEPIHPLKRFALHFWAPVPWMLEAVIALQLFLGEWLTDIDLARQARRRLDRRTGGQPCSRRYRPGFGRGRRSRRRPHRRWLAAARSIDADRRIDSRRDGGRKDRFRRRPGAARRGDSASHRDRNAHLFRADGGIGERGPRRERRTEGGPRCRSQSHGHQFHHHRGACGLCARHPSQWRSDPLARPDGAAVGGARRAAGDIHSRGGVGREASCSRDCRR